MGEGISRFAETQQRTQPSKLIIKRIPSKRKIRRKIRQGYSKPKRRVRRKTKPTQQKSWYEQTINY
ncbi:MAG: hypothetical protein ACTSXY_12390 [Promethearchaeota archaeon]